MEKEDIMFCVQQASGMVYCYDKYNNCIAQVQGEFISHTAKTVTVKRTKMMSAEILTFDTYNSLINSRSI